MKLEINLIILVYLLFTELSVIIINGQSILRVSDIPDFPFRADKDFIIEITSKNIKKIVGSAYDSAVICVTDGVKEDKLIFDYNFKEMIDQEYKGSFMRILSWIKNENHTSLIATVIFDRAANNKTLKIYQLRADSYKERKQMFDNLELETPIYEYKITLLIDPKLDLFIESRDGRKNELMLDEWSTATCRSYDGVPSRVPKLVNSGKFKMRPLSFSNERNEIKEELYVTVLDHLKELICRAGSTSKSVKINVLHHPSQILLTPEVSNIVENGTNITCSSIDGYPTPKVQWNFIKGPKDAKKYFNISSDNKILYMRSDAPLDTEWKFNCTAVNILPRSHGIFNRSVEFTIGRQTEGLVGLNLTLQIIIGVAVMSAIIIFCVVIVFIVCLARRSCVDHNASRNGRRNGGPVKTPAQMKSLEAEQVTLLPPGAPQNHLDMSNTGSGLPPPPPEYQLIIDGVKPVIPLEQQVSNDAYAEVTYAELNTSDLPMKEVKGHKANNNDDQVIYSQIIGTISTPDCAQRSYMNQENI